MLLLRRRAFEDALHRSDRQQASSTNRMSRPRGDDGQRMEPCWAVRIWARTEAGATRPPV